MKLLAAFGLLAIALAASSRQWEERSFNKGNTYEFEWKGQIVSGVPVKGSSSHSLQQIQSRVFITVSEKHSILRLDNVKLTNGHKQLTEPRIISEVSLEESELTSEQREQIKLPIRFRYHQGIISEIVFSEEESAWSENIKRSILNMLQVQMTPRKTQEEYNTKTVSNNKFFTVTERTLEGECEVAYTIVESEKNREEKQVTKSLNFEKCPKRIDIRYGPRYSAECSMCEATDARPESQTVISYKVRGEDEERFLITEVELKSEYVFSPFSKDQEMLATYVHQKMRLVDIKSAERVEEPRNGKKSSLLYNYEMELAREKFWMNGEEESYKLTGFAGVPKKELMEKYVRLTLASMEESEKDGVTLETNHNFARIVEVFRMCNEREIQEIHRHFWESDVHADKIEKVREFLIDALIAAGTKNTIEHFVDKCEKKQISPIRAAIVLKGLVNTRVPSENIVNSLLRLAKSKVCREEPVLRQSVLLTTGALMNGVCSKKEITKESWAIEIEGEKECRRELKTEWLKEWETLFESATTRYEKVLVLKAVANSALDVSIHFLEKVIYERRQPLVVRQAAVDALRMLREQMPRKVQSVCLPLFKSRREPVPLRISALYQLVHSRPERSLLDQIVHQLNIEPSTQLRSFGVSLLRSFSESKKNPCETKLAEDINVSLRMLRSSPLSTSTHVHLPWYSRLFDFGMTMDLASVFSNESVLPHELLASVDSVFAGQWNKHLVQVGLFQNNLDQVLIPLLKKLEKTETEIVLRGQRSSSKAPLREALKELVRQMKIQSRQNENGEDAFGMLYIRYKNLDYAVLPVEEELIEKIVRSDSSISSSEMIRKIAKGFRFEGVLSGYVYEHVRIVPTTFGLPLQVTSKLPTVAHIKAHIKAEISPKMSLRVEMEPSFVSTHVTEMTVFAPQMHIGSRVFHSIQSTLPIHGQVEYNDEKQQLKAVLRLPKEEKRVLLVESRPTTFVRSFNNKQVPVLEEKTIRIPSFEKTSVHYEQSYGEENFGLRTEVIGSVHRHVFEKKSPESVLFGENHVQIVLVPTAESVKEIVLEVEPKYTKMSSSEFESPRYDETFTEEEFRLETSDESEERADERVSRRTHSKKYYESIKSLKGHEGRVNFRLYTQGGPKTLKGEMSVKGSCDEEIKVCRFDLQCKRSPLLEKERRDWELQMNGELVLPESPKTIKELKEMRHKEVEGTLKCRWGAEEKNEMTIRLQKTQSQEMARFVKEIEYQSNKGLEKYDMLREASKLNKYVVLVDKDLSKDNELVFRRLFDLVKSEFYMYGQVESIRSDSRRFKLEAVVEPEECRRVNFTVECNGEKLIVKDAYSPIRIPLMSLGSRRVSLKGLNNKNSWASVFMPTSECEVSSNKVSTFDGLLYKTPLTTCYSVLAKDCSQEPEYVVMMKKMEKDSEEKKIKIMTQEKEIECELKQEKIVCNVDGRRVEDEETLYDMGIKLIGESSCEITIPKMTIRFDGFKAEIKADKRTENTQCGLCGHFDGRRDNEFRRADNEETEDIEEFHRSWLRRDNECEIDELKLKEKKNYGVESDEEERYDSEESFWNPREDSEEEIMGEKRSRKMLKKNLKNRINRKNIRDEEENTYEPENKIVMVEREGKTCFSTEEQPKCQPGDELVETEYRKVKLACVSRSDRHTRRMVNGLQRGEESIMEEIRSLPMTLTDRIELPKLCRVY